MYHYLDELKFKSSLIKDIKSLIAMLSYAHHRYVQIHPFLNGNGRSSRLLTDFLSMQRGYRGVSIYVREESEARKRYISALREADKGNYNELNKMITEQLLPL